MSGGGKIQAIMRLVLASQWAHQRRLKMVSRICDGLVRILFGASIPGRATIARSVFFHHSGIGVVINPASVIEEDCEIGVQVVLGGRAPEPGAPHLERGVIVHAGAKLIGAIRIGQGSVIAANAVVLADVPPNCLVAGVPGVIKRSGIDAAGYQTTSNPASKPGTEQAA